VDAAISNGVAACDLVVAGWNEPILDLIKDLEPITAALAGALDRD